MAHPRRTVVIEHVAPAVDGGRWPVKRAAGEVVEVSADIFKDGHDVLVAWLKYRRAAERTWRETPMVHVDNDRWAGRFTLDANARWVFTIEALPDPFRSWLADLAKRHAAGQDAVSELREGVALIRAAVPRVTGADGGALAAWAARLERASDQAAAVAAAAEPGLAALMERHLDRSEATWCEREFEVVADRPGARCAAWYEFFPRSSGTLKDAEAQLEHAAAMGFDVVYLPPIHPIGRTHRKGRNNALVAAPGDPGSPWAIGSEAGGHTAVHPDLGTLDDFDRFVARARSLGLEVALDFAIQCSPDHPWVPEHPEWFFHRPDGTIKHAENPPKKYQDVCPLDFYGADPRPLWEEMRCILEFWVGHGVRAFRVDNPHTKPVGFWAWLIRTIQDAHPDVIFLAEAFTRPKLMQALAKVGFTQSYTYFTWRNFKDELVAYLTELTKTEMAEYFRGNFFTNTPDILPLILQQGGRPAFKMRLALAATLSAAYGIYSGYELCENAALPGTEEYQDSEKYEIRVRDWSAPGHIQDYISRINQIRHDRPSLQESRHLGFYESDDDSILFYGKRSADGADRVWVAVNLDPFEAHEARLELPMAELGLPPEGRLEVHELITDQRQLWRGPVHSLRLDPEQEPAAIFRVTALPHKAFDDLGY
ncbi:MAG: alpha-1,4-glucan--maltose-1-phosphate maltosyltransferase [Candidatus Rokubacteria bacterium]|nr:alpha-1,4-glucan--maltose-1-phosphate maltosyltransferase [Candidatus Rokubacteria bacterium]